MKRIHLLLAAALLCPLGGHAQEADKPASEGTIAFSSRRRGMDIFLVQPDGSGLKRLTGGDGPSFSADGKKIAYAAYFNDTGSFEIFVINADGTDDRRVTKTEVMEQCPALSPDGKTIAFTIDETRDGASISVIHVMNADGSGRRRLVDGMTPAWSPDGTKLVFADVVKEDNYSSEIYVVDLDGSNRRRVTRNDTPDGNPAWSPDGKQIAFSSLTDRTVKHDICVIEVDGSGETRITRDEADDTDPAWSPDGRKIAFSSYRDKEGGWEILVMNADGSNPINVSKHASQDSSPTWAAAK